MIEFELRTLQSNLFLRYRKLFEKIYTYKEPINATILANELKKHKQQLTPILQKLENAKMIERKEMKEYQKRGGKSLFILLTKDTISLIKQSGYLEDVSFKVKIDTSKITDYINRFNEANNDFVRNQAMQGLDKATHDLIRDNIVIEWDSELNLETFLNSLIKDLDKYNNIVKSRLFAILERLYNNGYYDINNFNYLSRYMKKREPKDDTINIINYILPVLIVTINNNPDINSKHYSFFVEILNKIGGVDLDKFYSISNNRETLRNFPIEIRENLRNVLYKILNSFDDSEGVKRRSITEEILNIIEG